MQSVYDWIAVLCFCVVAVTFLQASTRPPPRKDNLADYFLPAGGCALFNWLGNEGQVLAAAAVLAGAMGFFAWRQYNFRRAG